MVDKKHLCPENIRELIDISRDGMDLMKAWQACKAEIRAYGKLQDEIWERIAMKGRVVCDTIKMFTKSEGI